MRDWLGRAALLAVGIALFFLLPHFVSDFRLFEFARVGQYFIAMLGLYVLTIYTGQVSIGHGAFMAIGGYTTGILVYHRHWEDVRTLPIAGLVAGVAGLLFGLPALRLRGAYLALATFALAVSVPAIIKKWESLTGGSTGLLFATFHTNRWYYNVTWATAGILVVLAWIVLASPVGRTWRALRDSEVAASSFGIWVPLYKTLAFGISAAYAGVAGGLLVILSLGANPNSFPVQLSIYLLVGVAIGSFAGIPGILLGAAFVEYVQVYAPKWVSDSPGIPTFAFGAALVLAAIVATAFSALTIRWQSGLKRGPATKETS
jgi:branched-chain amino acid transport system permease protein